MMSVLIRIYRYNSCGNISLTKDRAKNVRVEHLLRIASYTNCHSSLSVRIVRWLGLQDLHLYRNCCPAPSVSIPQHPRSRLKTFDSNDACVDFIITPASYVCQNIAIPHSPSPSRTNKEGEKSQSVCSAHSEVLSFGSSV